MLLHAYLDGELDAASAVAVRAQIEASPRLKAELAGARTLQRMLRTHFAPEPVAVPVRARIEAALGPRGGRAPSWRALAACLVGAIAISSGATFLALRPSDETVRGAILDSHMRALMASEPFDVASGERHVVKPWFNGRIPQAPRVVDLGTRGFLLLGARIDVIDRKPVPTLVYGRRLHKISLTALEGKVRLDTSRSDHGYNIASWNDGDVTYVATSDLNSAELNTFARLFAAAN